MNLLNKYTHDKYEFSQQYSIIGYSSFIIMLSYISAILFLKKKKKEISLRSTNILMNDDDCQLLASQAKRKAYKILINTMHEYHQSYHDNNFDNFLKVYWPKDYIILQKNNQGDTSCLRDYSDWKYLFKLTLKKLKDDNWYII